MNNNIWTTHDDDSDGGGGSNGRQCDATISNSTHFHRCLLFFLFLCIFLLAFMFCFCLVVHHHDHDQHSIFKPIFFLFLDFDVCLCRCWCVYATLHFDIQFGFDMNDIEASFVHSFFYCCVFAILHFEFEFFILFIDWRVCICKCWLPQWLQLSFEVPHLLKIEKKTDVALCKRAIRIITT